jgi:hypothetical protein
MARRNRLWGFTDAEGALLAEVTASVPTLRALAARAERSAGFPARWVVRASADELDDLYRRIEAVMADQSRERRAQLERMLETLSMAIDGI